MTAGKRNAIGVLAMATMWAMAGAVNAESSFALGSHRISTSANVAVTVVVPTHLSLRVLQMPGTLHVTPQDLARGYVEAPTPVDLVVQSNHRDGFRLLVSTTSPAIQRVVLSGEGQDIEAASSTVIQRLAERRGLQTSRLAWRARFYLSSSAGEGDIVLPLNVGLAP